MGCNKDRYADQEYRDDLLLLLMKICKCGGIHMKFLKILLFIIAGLLLVLSLAVKETIGVVIAVILLLLALLTGKKKKEKEETQQQSTTGSVMSQENEEPVNNKKTETIKVAGISNYTDAVLSLGCENDDYSLSKKEIIENGLEDEDIPEYTFPALDIRFEFEPDNEYDPNAIAIFADNVKIGYVKQGSTSHIRKLINEDRITDATGEIVGGNYKRLDSDEGTIRKEKLNFGARVTLTIKE